MILLLRRIAPLLLVLSAGQSALLADEPNPAVAVKPAETSFYPKDASGPAAFNAALANTKAQNKLAVIVFGADWCHDSRALARVLLSDQFKTEFGARFGVTFINVGKPQTGAGTNLDLVQRLGVKNLKSTPALFVISPKGKVVNSKNDAVSWRNAESRGAVGVLGWFRKLAVKQH